MREADVPAQQPEAQEEARIPPPDADPCGSGGAEGPARPGPQAPQRLIWRVRGRGTFDALGRARPLVGGPLRLRSVAGRPGPPQVAFAVGRRVGGSVQRNRMRRRLRAVVREHAAMLAPGSAYLVGAGPEAARMSHQELSEAVLDLLTRDASR